MFAEKIPVVSYFNGNDATKNIDKIQKNLTEYNIIRTKNLDKKLINLLLLNKDFIYLHIIISGMGGSEFEPNIQSPKTLFDNLNLLVKNGFPLSRILVLVEPVIPNMVGLRSMELLLKVMVRYKGMRLRQVKFEILPFFRYDKNRIDKSKMSTAMYIKKQNELQEKLQIYGQDKSSFLMLANRNIQKRPSYQKLKDYINHMDNKEGDGMFMKYFKQLLNEFKNFIHIDTTTIEPIGIREMKAFGTSTTFIDKNNVGHKLIQYDKKDKKLKGVNLMNGKIPTQCPNKCVLCPFK